jgi:hypothetical protein
VRASENFRRIAVVTDAAEPATPCGACRQLLWEYCGDIPVPSHSIRGGSQTFTWLSLFPQPFDDHFSTGKVELKPARRDNSAKRSFAPPNPPTMFATSE